MKGVTFDGTIPRTMGKPHYPPQMPNESFIDLATGNTGKDKPLADKEFS